MVARYGMSDKIGHVGYPDDHEVSATTQSAMEQEASLLLENAYKRATHVLKTNRGQLELLAKALITYDTLSLSEIQQVIQGTDIKEIKEMQRIEEEELRVREEVELSAHEITAPSDLKQKIKQ
jgi:ATP-dependent metalloprotease